MRNPRNRTAVFNAGALFSKGAVWPLALACGMIFLSTTSVDLAVTVTSECSQLYSREYCSSCHIRLGVLTGIELRACLLLSHSVLKFADSISLHLCMFSSDVILCSFHLLWPL